MKTPVLNINSWRSFSLNKLSQLSGLARETVQKRIHEANLKHTDLVNGHPVYDVWEVAKAVLTPTVIFDFSDPEKLPPKERKDYYEGSLAKSKLEKEQGNLIDYNEARQIVAEIIKPALNLMDAIPDQLERDHNLPPHIINDIEKKFTALRENWANQLNEL